MISRGAAGRVRPLFPCLRPHEAGKMRAEGKEYIVQDGDVMNFLFNV